MIATITALLLLAQTENLPNPVQLPFEPEEQAIDILSTFELPVDLPASRVIPLSALEQPNSNAAAEWMVVGDKDKLALDGLDPITFFEGREPRKGRPEYSASYHGALFRFESADHRDLFLQAPDKFSPAYGGYDPQALANGFLVPARVENWVVADNRLFLSGSPQLAGSFETEKLEIVRIADEKWRAAESHFISRFMQAHRDD